MSKVIKNWSYLLLSDVIQQVIGFVVVILLARKLSPEGYGLFNVIISIATIFSVVAHLGMSNVVIRELSLKPETTAAFIKKIILPFRIGSFALALISFLVYNSINVSTDDAWLIYVVLIILNLSLWNFSESVAFGHEVTKYSSILNISVSVIWLASILIIPEKLLFIKTVLIIYCILHFVKGASYIVLILKNFYLPEKFKRQTSTISYREFLKMVLPYTWLLLIFTLSSQLPLQFLNSNANLKEVGFYAVGFKLMVPISIAVGTAFKAIFPSLTRLFAKDKLEFQRRIKFCFSTIIISGTFVSIAGSLTSNYWLPIVFGEEYRSAVLVFNVLIWFSVLSMLDSLLSNGLSSGYKESVLAIIATIDIIILLPLIYYSSFYGAWGVAFMKLIAGILFLSYHLYIFTKILNVKIFNRELIILLGFYFLSLISCLIIENNIHQLIAIVTLLITVLTIRESPVVETFKFVQQKISKTR